MAATIVLWAMGTKAGNYGNRYCADYGNCGDHGDGRTRRTRRGRSGTEFFCLGCL